MMPPLPQIDWVAKLSEAKDSGVEFQALVHELVRARAEYEDAQSSAPNSQDGGVDIYSESQGTIWQCKFVGRDVKIGPLKAAAKEIKQTFNQLSRHFAPNSKPTKESPRDIWYDTKIKKYVYCFTAKPVHSTAKNSYTKLIREGFAKLAKIPKLAHLKNVEISVWDEVDIGFQLNSQDGILIRLKWFGLPLPLGVQTLASWKSQKTNGSESKPAAERNFHSYLFAPTLPYQARQSAQLAPEAILARLATEDVDTVVIYGSGGQGKTRLALEVGLAAESNKWIVLMLSAEASTAQALEKIARVTLGTKTLLIIDYAERTDSFSAIHQGIQALNTDGAKLHLLATCRSTKTHSIEDIGDLDLLAIDSEHSSSHDLIKAILGNGLHEFTDYCKGVPVFAAFIRLLSDRAQTNNLDKLRNLKDFGKWLRSHVQKLPDKPSDPLALAQLLCAMPSSSAVIEGISYAPAISTYKNQLLTDGWLVYSSLSPTEPWSCAHDMLADGAVIDALSEPRTREHVAAQLLRFALTHSYPEELIRTLSRVSHEENVSKVRWRSLFESNAASWLPHCGLIAMGQLIPVGELIDWLSQLGPSRDELVTDSRVRHALTNALRANDFNDETTHRKWNPWVEAVLTKATGPEESSRVLGLWLQAKVAPESIRDIVSAWLDEHGGERFAGYVYVNWLTANGDIQLAEQLFARWLNQYDRSFYAERVISEWLRVGGDPKATEESVGRWLGSPHRANAIGARHLYRNWLLAGGDKQLVQRKMVSWLEQYSEQLASSLVFCAWLDKGGSSDIVKFALKRWLSVEEHATKREAHFVYVSWLNANGSIELVRIAIKDWFATQSHSFSDRLARRHVICAWLDADGDPDEIQNAVEVWLSEGDGRQSRSFDAHVVYRKWLASRGDSRVVEASLGSWFSEHEQTRESQFIFSEWLNQGGALDVVRNAMMAWFAVPHNARSDSAFFGYLNWLHSGGSACKIQTAVELWLEGGSDKTSRLHAEWIKYSGDPKVFPAASLKLEQQIDHLSGSVEELISWLKSGHDPAAVRDAVVEWLNQDANLNLPEAAQLIRFWLERTRASGLLDVKAAVDIWLTDNCTFIAASFVLPELLEATGTDEAGTPYATATLRWLQHGTNGTSMRALYIFRAWFRSLREPNEVLPLLNIWLEIPRNAALPKCIDMYIAYVSAEHAFPAWLVSAAENYLLRCDSAEEGNDDVIRLRTSVGAARRHI